MSSIFKHQVNYYETDKMGCTHHSNYIRFMEEARVDYLEGIGCGYKSLEAEGIVSPVISVNVQFKKATTFGDLIEIEVKPKSYTGVKVEFEYIMKCGGEVVCLASSSHCFLDSTNRPISLKRSRLHQKFVSLIGD